MRDKVPFRKSGHIFVYIHKYIHVLYIMNCSKKWIVLVNFIYDDTSQNATINNQV